MAKAVAIFETPSSPVSAGAASVQVRSNATSHQAAGTSGAPTSATTVPPCVVSINSVSRAQTHECDLPNAGMITPASQRRKPVGSMKGQKYGKPRGKTCCWTPELDEVLKTAWGRGRLHAARRAIRQLQPTWSRYSIKKRAAALGLCRPKAQPWLDSEVNHLLWSIDSNASMALIAERLEETAGSGVHRRESGRIQSQGSRRHVLGSPGQGSILDCRKAVAHEGRPYYRKLVCEIPY